MVRRVTRYRTGELEDREGCFGRRGCETDAGEGRYRSASSDQSCDSRMLFVCQCAPQGILATRANLQIIQTRISHVGENGPDPHPFVVFLVWPRFRPSQQSSPSLRYPRHSFCHCLWFNRSWRPVWKLIKTGSERQAMDPTVHQNKPSP